MNTSTANNRTPLGLGWTDALIGLWLVLSPFLLHFANNIAGVANNLCVGIALILLTLGSVRLELLKALIGLMGAWLYASAFILGVPQKAFLWNNLILAFLVVLFAVAGESPYPRPPHRSI
jgi:hypothetical protein